MTKAPTLSVIVPVYNLELYVERCLESVSAQTFRDLEILVIDDGSTDASPEVLAELAEHDPRVTILRQPNGGHGAAANVGLDRARGLYVMFVDGDDFIEPHVAETLLHAARDTDAELVMGNLRYHLSGGRTDIFKPVPGATRILDDADRRALFDMSATPCARLYARRIFDAEGVRFPAGILFADVAFSPKTYLAARRIAYLDRELYDYDLTRPAQSMKQTDHRVLEVVPSLTDLLRHCQARGLFDPWRPELLRYALKHVIDWLPKVRALPPESHVGAVRTLFGVLDRYFDASWTGAPLRQLAGRRRGFLIEQARRVGYAPLAWSWALERLAHEADELVESAAGAPLASYQRAKAALKRRVLSRLVL
ncbi:MAG: glycosyltransferase [Myxococcota bacterium]